MTLMLTDPEWALLESCFQKNHISFYCNRTPTPGRRGLTGPAAETRILISSHELAKAKALLRDIGMYSSDG
jgi:hypothetical protein